MRALATAAVWASWLPGLVFGAPCTATGVVKDSSGAPVGGVTITLSTAARITRASALSQADGSFSLGPLPCGDYLLSATRLGLAEGRQVRRLEHGSAPLEVTLAPAALQEHITETAEAGGVERAGEIDARVTALPRVLLEQRVKTVLTEAARGEAGVHEQRTAPAMGSFVVRGLTGKNVSVYRDGFRYTTAVQRGGVFCAAPTAPSTGRTRSAARSICSRLPSPKATNLSAAR